MLRSAAAAAAVLVALGGCGGGGDDTTSKTSDAVREQLRYLPERPSVVLAVDLRWEGPNWRHIRDHAERGLDAYRENARAGEEVPESVDEGLRMLGGEAGISFEDDIRPLLDGHVVVAIQQPPTAGDGTELREATTVYAFRTRGEGLRETADKLHRIEGGTPRPHPDHEDVVLYGSGTAVVGDDVVIDAEGPDNRRALEEALDRAQGGEGLSPDRLAEAERRAGVDDPFLLATADRTIARAYVTAPNLERAEGKVPYLDAIRDLHGALRVDEDGAEIAGVVATDPEGLEERDLPLAPPGELDLPRTEGITGASRDQSYTTTFLSRTVRALFADSDFAKAVERAERDLGVTFEEEVLRQFSCPSVSELTPSSQRFGARSCVKDPERMRELLPRLSRHLPRIITSLQRLEDEGLIALLLIAPDAPLVPGFTPAQIQVTPPDDAAPDEEHLYEVTGLTDTQGSRLAPVGPDRIVFGMIGDAFVVASDREMARRAAKLEGERLDEDAASAVRVPLERLLLADEGEDERTDRGSAALYELLGQIELTASATREELRARGRLDLSD